MYLYTYLLFYGIHLAYVWKSLFAKYDCKQHNPPRLALLFLNLKL